MSKRAKELAQRLKQLNSDIIAFVQTISGDDWTKICPPEDWTVGVTARHIAAGHYGIIDLVKKMVKDQPLPAITMDEIIAMANRHARDYAECTKEEVLMLLKENGRIAADFILGLSDDALDKQGDLPAFGKVTVERLIKMVLFHSGATHLESMKSAAAQPPSGPAAVKT